MSEFGRERVRTSSGPARSLSAPARKLDESVNVQNREKGSLSLTAGRKGVHQPMRYHSLVDRPGAVAVRGIAQMTPEDMWTNADTEVDHERAFSV